MPLKIQLRPKERIIINGAVIEGHPDSRTEIVVMNKARIMRQKHIMQEKDANSPSKRLYFALQMLYIDPDNEKDYLEAYEKYLDDLKNTVSLPPLVEALGNIETSVEKKQYYDALKVCRELTKTEEEIMKIGKE